MRIFFTLLLIGIFTLSYAQNKYTLSGYVKDAGSGETLIAANVFVKDQSQLGNVTNVYGFYSLTLPEGEYTIVASYLGFQNKELRVNLNQDTRLNIELTEGVVIEEVVVTAEEKDRNVESTEMGTVDLLMDDVKKLPAFMGEVDILKTLQLLPGVMSAGEGNSGFYVRGGGPDQNLILLDEAPVYNTGHLLGFFSVFNADAIKNTTLIKGGMPAQYGGRLSSVVDVQMKEGNDKYYAAEGGIGLIASRLTFEGPIVKNKSSFIISGRRTYAFDIAQPFLEGTNFEGTNYYFYDLNAKVNYRFSDKDRLFASAYFGRDVLDYKSNQRGFNFKMPWGNATTTLRWNHLFSDKLFMNVSAIYNAYDFEIEGSQDQFTLRLISGIEDWNAKVDFDFFPSVQHSLKFGANYTYHTFTPNIASSESGDVSFESGIKEKFAHESAIYIQDNYKINPKLTVDFGLRGSMFTQVGPYESKSENKTYDKGEPVVTYTGLEPRLGAKYTLNQAASLKLGVTYNNQYIHLVTSSSGTLPTDIWLPSTQKVKPQKAIQYAVGYFQNFLDDKYETSIELYYKDLWDQIEYSEYYVPSPTVDEEDQFVFGRGRSYGLELFIKKRYGKLNGWVGYTLSRTTRSFDEIQGVDFLAKYDRTHDLSVVGNYQFHPKWNLGGAFIFGTGNNYTPLEGLSLIGNEFVLVFGDRNSVREDNYHRIDLSLTYDPSVGKEKQFHSTWTFSVYNAYNRRNTFLRYYDVGINAQTGAGEGKAYKVSIFPIIPSITWNFKWKQKVKEEKQEF